MLASALEVGQGQRHGERGQVLARRDPARATAAVAQRVEAECGRGSGQRARPASTRSARAQAAWPGRRASRLALPRCLGTSRWSPARRANESGPLTRGSGAVAAAPAAAVPLPRGPGRPRRSARPAPAQQGARRGRRAATPRGRGGFQAEVTQHADVGDHEHGEAGQRRHRRGGSPPSPWTRRCAGAPRARPSRCRARGPGSGREQHANSVESAIASAPRVTDMGFRATGGPNRIPSGVWSDHHESSPAQPVGQREIGTTGPPASLTRRRTAKTGRADQHELRPRPGTRRRHHEDASALACAAWAAAAPHPAGGCRRLRMVSTTSACPAP